VAEEAASNPSPFDVRSIRHLVRLMTRHDLSEIDLREGQLRIRLRRGTRGEVLAPEVSPQLIAAPVAASPAASQAPTEQDKIAKTLVPIKSPTPGTFYASASPEAEPFVTVGSKVTPTTVVCVIEAMKIFNEINADCAGIITEILVENQQPVEFGQVLFKVDPTG
jgi:acetyl-CoA carboxylase biotin carboxyl carrier protein